MKSVINGETIKLKKGRAFEMICCDCNLVHMVFSDKDCNLTVYRDDFKTKKLRRR